YGYSDREALHAFPTRRSSDLRRAEVESRHGRRVGIEAQHRAKRELEPRDRAAGDVAAHEVRILALERGRVPGPPREDDLAEAGRETLDLRLDRRRDEIGRASCRERVQS